MRVQTQHQCHKLLYPTLFVNLFKIPERSDYGTEYNQASYIQSSPLQRNTDLFAYYKCPEGNSKA